MIKKRQVANSHSGCRLRGGTCSCGNRPCAVELREKGDETTEVDLNLVDESGERP